MSAATKEKGGSFAKKKKSHRSKASNGVEQSARSVCFSQRARNLVNGCVQNMRLHCQVQGQADGSGVWKSESNHLKIILIIISEYHCRANMVGSKTHFIIHIRWLPTLCIFKIIPLFAQ